MKKSFTFKGIQHVSTDNIYPDHHRSFSNYPTVFSMAYEVKVNPDVGIRYMRRPATSGEGAAKSMVTGYELDYEETNYWGKTGKQVVFFLTSKGIANKYGVGSATAKQLMTFAADAWKSYEVTFPANPAEINSLIEGPYNYLFGNVQHNNFSIMFPDESQTADADHSHGGLGGVPTVTNDILKKMALDRLPKNLHYFDLSMPINEEVDKASPQNVLYVALQPNYNFYVPPLEARDKTLLPKFPAGFDMVMRPSDLYAYTSLKIRDIEKIAANEFAIKTLYEYNKTFGTGGKDGFEFGIETKLNGFYNNYLKLNEGYASKAQVSPDGWNKLYQNAAADNYFMSFMPGKIPIKPINFQINSTSFVSPEKLLIEAANGREKTLPFSITVESNYNMVPENANNEFKQILKDLNLYETFIYNLIDRHDGPFFSISDDAGSQSNRQIDNTIASVVLGQADTGVIDEKNSDWDNAGNDELFGNFWSYFAIPRAPLVAETLKYAFKASGLVSPKAPQQDQSAALQDLRKFIVGDTEKALEKLYSAYNLFTDAKDTTGKKTGQTTGTAAASSAHAKVSSDFVYTDFDENTTVTDFDAFVFAGKMEQFVDKHYLSLTERMFENVAEGTLRKEPLKNYVEILAYSVQRYRVNRTNPKQHEHTYTEAPIEGYTFEQEYIFPASMEKKDILKCVDAGVIYNTEYIYRFYCHVLSLGTGVKPLKIAKERGEVLTIGPANTKILQLENLSYPDLRVMRVPVFQTKPTLVYDRPPAFPSAIIIPSRQDSSKVKIVFSENVGGYFNAPRPIFATDLWQTWKLIKKYPHLDLSEKFFQWVQDFIEVDKEKGTAKFYKMNSDGFTGASLVGWFSSILEKFQFDSKSPIEKFEILRLDFKPLSYSAFQSAKRFIVNKVDGVGVTQTIKPNKTYYYCFRTINMHGIVSNPSPVLSLNVYDDGDIHTAEVKPYSFKSETQPEPPIKPLVSNGIIGVSLSDFQALVATDKELEEYEKDTKSSNAGQLAMLEAYGPYPNANEFTIDYWLNNLKLKAQDPNKNEAMDTGGKAFFKVRARSRTTGRTIDLNFHPKIKRLDHVGNVGEQAFEKMKSEGFSGGDLVELSNYFDMSVKSLKTLINNKDEVGVDPVLIETIIEKIRNNQLDQQALESLLVNFRKLKST
jgi:hypothetical protein